MPSTLELLPYPTKSLQTKELGRSLHRLAMLLTLRPGKLTWPLPSSAPSYNEDNISHTSLQTLKYQRRVTVMFYMSLRGLRRSRGFPLVLGENPQNGKYTPPTSPASCIVRVTLICSTPATPIIFHFPLLLVLPVFPLQGLSPCYTFYLENFSPPHPLYLKNSCFSFNPH